MKSEKTREGEMERGCQIEIVEGRFTVQGMPEAQGRKITWMRLKRKRPQQKESNLQQEKEEEGKLVDARLIHESVGRDLKCNSCQHHVPRSLKHSILCRKYSPHGPPGTRPYRCFTSCPNCFVEWELWPNNRYAESFDVLSGATYQEIIPEHNPNSNLGGEGPI